eukprot:gnl/MRDRNA2_/MRDRNA2_276548_c0_seq1.p1 gnl/MRDRNA2_/MRDRNA2_276548_c0~~gnl/MRDRNA2_/MRDRNA2_276548_c0_seq1.p1  ORF type:complete len:418 (-),score=81.12 gnl/MRDRNA2_/MRDRNA2_276548_c0_seq1:144-1214(-)
MAQEVSVSIFDHDYLSSDDLLGAVHQIPVSRLLGKPEGLWMKLTNTPAGEASSILMKAKLMTFSTDSCLIEKLLNVDETRDVTSTQTVIDTEKENHPEVKTGLCMCTGSSMDCNSPAQFSKIMGVHSDKDRQQSHRQSTGIAALRCTLHAGRISTQVLAHGCCELRLSLGNSMVSQQVSERPLVDVADMAPSIQNAVERLSMKGLDVSEIASALSEEAVLVQRVLDSRLGWNVESHKFFCLVITAEDLKLSQEIAIELLSKGTCLARATCPLHQILSGGAQTTAAKKEEEHGLEETFKLASVDQTKMLKVELQLKLELRALVEKSLSHTQSEDEIAVGRQHSENLGQLLKGRIYSI